MDKLIPIVYGLILLAGAFIGFKAGSQVSLYAGLISGGIVFVGVYLLRVNPAWGYGVLTSVGVILTIVFLMRFLKTKALMPGGMLAVLSLAFFLYCLSRILGKH